jgi:hypothetical protein
MDMRPPATAAQNASLCSCGPIGFALVIISQWHKELRYVLRFVRKMEATTTFPSRERTRDNTGALVAAKVTNPPNQYDEVGRTARAPATQRVATGRGSRPGQQPRAQQRQAARLPISKRQEERPPAQDSYYGPRATKAETTAIGCEECGRKGQPASMCKSFRHPNWNSQHATVPYKNSVIGQAIKRLTSSQLRSSPQNGVQWLPVDEVWTGGEALIRSWKASILGPSNQAQAAATDHRPDQTRKEVRHFTLVWPEAVRTCTLPCRDP